MGHFDNILMRLTRQLFPKGAAFRFPFGGITERLEQAFIKSEARMLEDARAVLSSRFPDDPAFDVSDAAMMEQYLGLVTSPGVTLAVRKQAISRKLSYPGTTRPRQSRAYLEGQLQKAGFDVYVYENRFDDGAGGWETRSPAVVLGTAIATADLDMFELDEAELDGAWSDTGISIVANYISEADDAGFSFGDNYRSTFYIAGNPITTFADVDVRRKDELRELILRIKPAQTAGILFINYV